MQCSVGRCLQGSTQSALTLSNVAGIFYILVSGLALSILVSLGEYVAKTHNKVSCLYPMHTCTTSCHGFSTPRFSDALIPKYRHIESYRDRPASISNFSIYRHARFLFLRVDFRFLAKIITTGIKYRVAQ